MKKTFRGLSTIRTIYITMPRSTAAQTKTADPKHPKNTKKQNEKTHTFPKKAFKQKALDRAKTLRFKGFGPKRGEAPSTPKPQKSKTKKRATFPRRPFEKKRPIEPKPCVLNGLARNAATPQAPKNHKKQSEQKHTHIKKRPFEKKRPIKPKPCVLKGLARKAASRPRAKKQPKNTKNRNPKRPKSFSGDFELCLRQLLALRASRAPTPAALCGLAWEQPAKEKTRGPREEPQKARSSES